MAADAGFMKRVARVRGTSGGAIAGAMLLQCPDRIDDALDLYTSGELLAMMRFPYDLTHPHDALFRRVLARMDLLPADAHQGPLGGGKFVAHVTAANPEAPLASLAQPKVLNVGLSAFKSTDEVVSAISASCCLTPASALYGGRNGI